MPDELRGLFVLEPPSGGQARLRQALQRTRQEGRWLPLLPWATAATLLAFMLTVGELDMRRLDDSLTERILSGVHRQDPAAWTQLPGTPAGVPVYLARPSGDGAEQGAENLGEPPAGS
jgi:hypothetical protein